MSDDITTLTQDLTTTLQPPQNADTLDRQAQILDQIFTSIMSDKVAERLPTCDRWPETTMEWITLALKIQKQCVDTTKAKAAIEYMNGLSGTLPRKIEKQKEGS